MKRGLFITGTDTNVGKTLVSATLVSALLQHKRNVGYHKPCQTGDDSDSQTVLHLSGLPHQRLSPPVYEFPMPAAPSRAAQATGATIHTERFRERWQSLPEGDWILEGAGGLRVPLNSQETVQDLIRLLNVPALLVASTRLGCINHILLSLASLQSANIPVRGVVLSGEDDPGLVETLRDFAPNIPFLRFPLMKEIHAAALSMQAKECFPEATLNLLMGAHP